MSPSFNWSVTNQAWVHEFKGEHHYSSVEDAVQRWPETATCMAARMKQNGEIEIFSSYGFTDAYELPMLQIIES